MSFLKNHPFDVEAFFEHSIVLTFAIPCHELLPFLPQCLELDTFDNKWGFMAIALVKTKGLRPKGFPAFLGNDFYLIGYRVFVRYTNHKGKRLRGLYILKSETNKKKMEFLGNIFTHYKYTTTDICEVKEGHSIQISSLKSKFSFLINYKQDETNLPQYSPFVDWKEARRFAGPLPFTFSYDPSKKEVLIIEGVRENWTPKPIVVLNYDFTFFDELNFKDALLANAFITKNIPYWWKKGKKEIWQ